LTSSLKKNKAMKKLKFYFVPLVMLVTLACANAQTADDIIGKHIDAIGGKDKISQVKTIVMESALQVMGNESATTTTIVNGVGYISESDFNGQKIVQCCTDKGGWAINPFGGGSTAQPIPDEEYKAEKDQIYIGGPLVDYAARGYKAELLPKDGDNFKIKLTSPDNLESTYFIDGTTYYITKMTHKGFAQGQEIEITSTFSNYKKTDFGYVMPFKIDLDLGQFQLSYVVNKVDINKEIDPAIFDMPK
ncbi:MAG TPA: hypothetical protein VIJ92_18100, partial [Ginsengibacter sp.]